MFVLLVLRVAVLVECVAPTCDGTSNFQKKLHPTAFQLKFLVKIVVPWLDLRDTPLSTSERRENDLEEF
jgi:hypothetical protein